MQSSELQELTASEPLTETEEYEMQQTWLHDDDKCTFIVLNKEVLDSSTCEEDAMIGDTNMYLTTEDGKVSAEVGIMIAESTVRRKRMGWEAILLAMRYGMEHLNVDVFVAKISTKNSRSINMFEKMNFVKESESRIFEEVTLIRPVTVDWVEWLKKETEIYVILETEENV
ncbi:N-acetyltransferase 9-like protein isoform X2 [Nilaparvata lugens]|nr:N-acetyltransferase 9-like protein isoform X2 [Nilaparvata lugens]